MSASDLLPGTQVEMRGLRWHVVRVEDHAGSPICRLRGLGGSASGEEVDVLLNVEDVRPIRYHVDPKKPGRLREWLLYHKAFLLEQALGPHALLAAQPGRLEIQPYQLVAVLRALSMSRVRLLLADSVGLGKTVQAGLILTELMARRLAQRILIVSPPGPLLEQWRTEMRDRFGMKLRVVDRTALDDTRRQVELGANPFDHIGLALTSVDFVKQERVLAELERTSYDVVIIDEAHHCVDLAGAGLRDDSLRRRLAEVLAGRCDTLLLLTATPHDGNDRSFASLCELLDSSLVDGRGVLRGEKFRAHVVRRLKRHIRDPRTGEPLFPERIVLPRRVIVKPSENPVFSDLSRQLLALLAPELRRALREKRFNEVLSFFALLKRSVSTVAACRSTLEVVLKRYREALQAGAEDQESRRERIRSLRDARRRLERFGVASASEEGELEQLELEDVAQKLAELEKEARSEGRKVGRTESITAALEELVSLATRALPHDPKIAALMAEIDEIRKIEPSANILIYSEYTTSQAIVAEALKQRGLSVLTLCGDDPDVRRIEVTERFRTTDGVVMVCTDAAAEGLNLHQRCHHLIHLELPFNPNRLEQRNGRIDRYGQKHQPVVRYLHLAGTFEENILLRLIAKYERQRAQLTYVPNTLGLTASAEQTSERLLRGVIESDQMLFADEPVRFTMLTGDPSDDATGPVRELLDEIDRSFQTFEKAAKSHAWLADAGLHADESSLRAADQAKHAGDESANVDLAPFVIDAVLRDGGKRKGQPSDPWFELTLPGSWGVDLADTPGVDPDTRTIRITTNMEVIADDQQRSIGYLGRAHPLVRHTIDRVRNTSLGDGSGQIDVRATAVKANVPKPVLVGTFLARVTSAAGREFERVVSVQMTQSTAPAYSDLPRTWLRYAIPDKAIAATGIWDKYFAAWAADSLAKARDFSQQNFTVVGEAFIKEAAANAARERTELEKWLSERAAELLPPETPRQAGLFDDAVPAQQAQPQTPLERLAALGADGSQTTRLRSQVAALLRLYNDRRQRLSLRAKFNPPEVVPLGVLMVVPEGDHAD